MRFFDRMSNGWKLGMTSLSTIRDNTSLLLFPILSSLALLFVAATFLGGAFAWTGFDIDRALDQLAGGSEVLLYVMLFAFYLVSYFIIVFFNVALVHCARLIFDGKEATIRDGLNFSGTRIGSIVQWAFLAATVGIILKTLEERLGFVGQIVVSIIGMVWSIATFFVVPVIAYEDINPIQAVKRSGKIMGQKFGESIGANFSFGIFYLLGYVFILITAALLFAVSPVFGIVVGFLLAVLLHTVVSAAEMVFVAATYNMVHEQPAGRFNEDVLDSMFFQK